nr:reverse transcriptase domain, reverse transcriptase zinc-binding domain protein [Tanacetum cinerariifolium]
YSKPEDPNELFQKLLGDLKELAKYGNSQSRDRPIFLNDDEDHSDQNKECFENSSDEIATSNSNEENEEPRQDFDIHQLIEKCSTEIFEEHKQKMEDTMLELIEICRQKEIYCMHDNVEDLIESSLNSKLLLINSNSQRLDNKEQEVKNIVEQPVHAVAPILSTKEPEYSPSMGYEHSNTTPKTKSNEIIKSDVEELIPILSEDEVTLEDKRECDMLVCEDSSTSDVCDNHFDIFSDSKIDDDILVYDDDFEDIEYVEASLSDPEIVSVEEENVVQQEEEEVDLEDISQIQDIVLREKLLSITRLISNIEYLNDNPTPGRVLNSFASDNSLSDNFRPNSKLFAIIRKRREVTKSKQNGQNRAREWKEFRKSKPKENSSQIHHFPYCPDITREEFSMQNLVVDLVNNGAWQWPNAWVNKASSLCTIPTPILTNQKDVVHCQDLNGTLKEFSVRNVWEDIRPRGDVYVFVKANYTFNSQRRIIRLILKGLVVPVFYLGDDPIACLYKAMAFLIAPKRPKNETWYKGKTMLPEAQEAGQILDEEQLAFLADPRVLDGQAVQTIIPNNASFQTKDLDTYDFDYDDISNAKLFLMANISNYGSDVILKVPHSKTYLNDMENQSVHAMQDLEQTQVVDVTDNEITSDSNIISYSQYLQETQQANVQDTNLQAQQD